MGQRNVARAIGQAGNHNLAAHLQHHAAHGVIALAVPVYPQYMPLLIVVNGIELVLRCSGIAAKSSCSAWVGKIQERNPAKAIKQT